MESFRIPICSTADYNMGDWGVQIDERSVFGDGHRIYSGGGYDGYFCVCPPFMILQNMRTHIGEVSLAVLDQGCGSDQKSPFSSALPLVESIINPTALYKTTCHSLKGLCSPLGLERETFGSQAHHTRFGLKIYLKKFIPGQIDETYKATGLFSCLGLEETSTILWHLVVNVARDSMVRRCRLW